MKAEIEQHLASTYGQACDVVTESTVDYPLFYETELPTLCDFKLSCVNCAPVLINFENKSECGWELSNVSSHFHDKVYPSEIGIRHITICLMTT